MYPAGLGAPVTMTSVMKSFRFSIVALMMCAAGVAAQPVREGAPAPEIDLPVLTGGRLQLSKLRGHPVVLSFWGTWCPPCRDEFPELVRMHESFGPSGLRVIGVNARDRERSTRTVKEFIDEFRVAFPVALDQRGIALRSYRLVGLPSTVFVDSAGIVRRVHMGPISREDLERGVAAILTPR